MLEAAFWGFVGGASLLLGAAAGLFLRIPQRTIGIVMAFGAGVLISALAFELTDEADRLGGADAVAVGLALGGIVYWGANRILDRRGAAHRKRSTGRQEEGNPGAITLGAVLDGIPESAAIGLTILAGKGVSIALVAAVFLSNVPESLSAATGFTKAGWSRGRVLGMWALVAAVSALSAAAGYALLDGASGNVLGGIQAFAAGAILVMLVDTMIPEAFEVATVDATPEERRFVERMLTGNAWLGLFTCLGFALAYLLSTVE